MSIDTDRLSPSIVPDVSPSIVPELAPDDRRASLFRESALERLERWALGLAWPLKPQRIGGLPALARLWLSDLIAPDPGLPDPERTFNAAGLCGIVHELSVPTLTRAYERGLFTFAHVGPLKWMSPPERCVLYFDETHIAKKLRRQMRQGRYSVTFDRDFEGVIHACAGRRDGKWHVTWITPRIMHTYAELFDDGVAHSFEVWNETGALVGGGYGVALGRVFFTESQFSREPNTSKIGFTALNWHLATWGYRLNDGKFPTPTILDMGFRTVRREKFLAELAANVRRDGKPGRWSVETDLANIAAWEPGVARAANAARTKRAPSDAMGF
jgi:leucyl/phenylalanyl-tRNA--protein transferase